MRSTPQPAVPEVSVGAVTTPVEIAPLPLDRVLALIGLDAACAPERYLEESRVPEGGE
jgi:hypothetical protein